MPDLTDLREAFVVLERQIPDGYRSPVVHDRLARLPLRSGDFDALGRHDHRRRNLVAAAVAVAAVVLLSVAVAALTRSGGNHAQVGGHRTTPHESATAAPSRVTSQRRTVSGTRALTRLVQGGAPVMESVYQRGAARSGEPLQPTRGGVTEFTTPSGNISCGMLGFGNTASIACEVRQYSFTTPPKPPSCQQNWGASWLSIESGRAARGLCLGGPPFDPVSTVLPYGRTIWHGSIACRSDSAFLACADVTSGHGFVVNRTNVKTY